MFDRFKNVVNGMVNKTMQKMETPEVLAAQAEEQLEKSVKEVLEAFTAAKANEKLLEKQIKANAEELAKWEQRAVMAVQQNNDDIAKQCLMKKQELKQAAETLTRSLEEQKINTENLKVRHAELDAKYREFRVKKDGMTERAKASEAIAKANELLSSNSTTGFDELERKINEREHRAAALGEMAATPTEDKIKKMDDNAKVEDDLAALKEQMGKVKLVVGKDIEPEQTVVDDNVPMVVEGEVVDEDEADDAPKKDK